MKRIWHLEFFTERGRRPSRMGWHLAAAVFVFLLIASPARAETCEELGGTIKASCASGEVLYIDADDVSETQSCCAPNPGGTAKPVGTQALPSAGSAASDNGKGTVIVSYGLRNPIGSRSVNDIAAALIRYASVIAGTLMMIFLIWGGVQYMTASDAKGTQAARSRIAWALIGIAVIFFAYVMIDAIISLSSVAPV